MMAHLPHLPQLPSFDPSTVSAVGWLPVVFIFAAQWRGSDKLWTLTNALFAIYHTLFTRIPSLAICAVALTAISAWRWRRGAAAPSATAAASTAPTSGLPHHVS